MTGPLDAHHERSRRLHPSVWKPQRWLWEAVTLGVTLAGLAAFVWFCALIVAYSGHGESLLAALGRP